MEKLDLKPMDNKHKKKLEELGLIKLGAKLKSSANDKNTEENLTVFTFLKEIYNLGSLCEKDGDDETNVGVSELVNSLTDEDIKNIINYIDSLDSDDITNKRGEKKDKIYHLLPISLTKECGVNEKRSLELKKESLILELMNWGINPFKIKECLQNESNKSEFKSLTWNKICEDAVSFKKEIQDSMYAYYENTGRSALFDEKSRWDIPLLFLNYMYLIETLGNQSANDEIADLCYKNISNGEYIHIACNGIMIPFFLIKYLEYEFGNQKNINSTENLLEQKNKIFVETLMSNESEWVFNNAKKKLKKQNTDNKSIRLLFYDIKSNCQFVFCNVYNGNNLYKCLIPKFWEIIDGLSEQCIFVFAVEMMKEVTLTRQQLDSVKSKIQNENLRLYLEKFNYDQDHKRNEEDIIRKGTKISWVNYLCEKLFRGIGYLIAIIFITAVHAAILIFLMLAPFNWYICLYYTGLGGHFIASIICGIWDDYPYTAPIFKKCVHFMQRVYDKTVGRLMKIWALHYPVNKMPEPENKISVPLNTPSGEINIISIEVNENENTPPEIEEKNNIQNGNNNIEGNNHKD